jgi:hypothetical protein
MVFVPVVVKIVGRVAVADAKAPVLGLNAVGTSAAVHGGVPHVENVTEPVGPTPELCVAMAAVNVTVCPVAAVARSAASVVVVVAFVTITVSAIWALTL